VTELELRLATRCVVLEYELSHAAEVMPVGIGGAYLRFVTNTGFTPGPEDQARVVNRADEALKR